MTATWNDINDCRQPTMLLRTAPLPPRPLVIGLPTVYTGRLSRSRRGALERGVGAAIAPLVIVADLAIADSSRLPKLGVM